MRQINKNLEKRKDNTSATRFILAIIVMAQFLCTTLWFVGNSVIDDLITIYGLDTNALGHLTTAVQLGFIIGTLCFAIFMVADRYSPSKVFFWSAIAAAIINLLTLINGQSLSTLILIRFGTGFFLAGIYPIGMKIAADYFDKELGKSLGYLVGALVLGTAFPHLLSGITAYFDWKSVITATTLLALIGGSLMIMLMPDGPFRKAGKKLDISLFFKVFTNKNFRSAAFGYFGHMWELYAFWAFVPVLVNKYFHQHHFTTVNTSFLSFCIIGIGFFACIIGGYFSLKIGAKAVALVALFFSGTACLFYPLISASNSPIIFISFMLLWGIMVISDSPMFSTLVAKNSTAETKGTALTIVNCIGFAITIISIQLLSYLWDQSSSEHVIMILAIGPILGLISLYGLKDDYKRDAIS